MWKNPDGNDSKVDGSSSGDAGLANDEVKKKTDQEGDQGSFSGSDDIDDEDEDGIEPDDDDDLDEDGDDDEDDDIVEDGDANEDGKFDGDGTDKKNRKKEEEKEGDGEDDEDEKKKKDLGGEDDDDKKKGENDPEDKKKPENEKKPDISPEEKRAEAESKRKKFIESAKKAAIVGTVVFAGMFANFSHGYRNGLDAKSKIQEIQSSPVVCEQTVEKKDDCDSFTMKDKDGKERYVVYTSGDRIADVDPADETELSRDEELMDKITIFGDNLYECIDSMGDALKTKKENDNILENLGEDSKK